MWVKAPGILLGDLSHLTPPHLPHLFVCSLTCLPVCPAFESFWTTKTLHMGYWGQSHWMGICFFFLFFFMGGPSKSFFPWLFLVFYCIILNDINVQYVEICFSWTVSIYCLLKVFAECYFHVLPSTAASKYMITLTEAGLNPVTADDLLILNCQQTQHCLTASTLWTDILAFCPLSYSLHFPLSSHLLQQLIYRQLKYFCPTLRVRASDGWPWCEVLLVSHPQGVSHRWETINRIYCDNSNHIAARLLSIYICSLLLSKPKNIMSTNNSEQNEINESYNCVWNCNYCYHSPLLQGFSVSRCANGNDCHCSSGLDQPSSELPALLTCNYWFLLTDQSCCWEITGSRGLSRAEMTHVASRWVRLL